MIPYKIEGHFDSSTVPSNGLDCHEPVFREEERLIIQCQVKDSEKRKPVALISPDISYHQCMHSMYIHMYIDVGLVTIRLLGKSICLFGTSKGFDKVDSSCIGQVLGRRSNICYSILLQYKVPLCIPTVRHGGTVHRWSQVREDAGILYKCKGPVIQLHSSPLHFPGCFLYLRVVGWIIHPFLEFGSGEGSAVGISQITGPFH